MAVPNPRRTNRKTPLPDPARTPPRRLPRASSSKPASRFATPARTQEKDRLQPILDDIMSQASFGDVGMDVDQSFSQVNRGPKPDTVFAKSKEFTVSFHSHLPEEVRLLLRNADFFRDSYSGDVDPTTEFSLVATAETCYAWQHTQALTGVPTCYIFPCPLDRITQSAPFHAFVPYSTVREPGLILMSPSGEIRFWDNIGIGLAGGDHYFKAALDLKPDEVATSLIRSDPQTYVASTSEGGLFRLTLTSTGGKYHLASRRFSRPQSSLSLSRIFPLWAPQTLQPELGNIAAIALGESSTSGRGVWAIVGQNIQQWNMTTEGWEVLLRQDDIMSTVTSAIRESLEAPEETDLDLEFLDMVYERPNPLGSLSSSIRSDASSSASRRSGHLNVLVSHVPLADAQDVSMADVPRRLYVIVQLSILVDSLHVERLVTVPYQSTFGSSQPPVAPSLQLMLDGLLFIVQFGDAIAICARDNEYKDRIALKSLQDRTLGVGVVNTHSELLVLSATTLMKAVVDYDEVSAFDYEYGRSGLIKSIMTQAILYGSYPGNPLHFGFPPEVDGESLMAGAEMLSTAVLESDPELVFDGNDITSQIATRKERLSFLIKFINENGVLGKISQRCRQKLAVDAEKLYAAQQLWFRLEEFLAQGHRESVLSDVILEYMAKIGEAHYEDPIRVFFRVHVADLGRLVPYISEVMGSFLQRMVDVEEVVLSETATAVLTILNRGLQYREYNKGVYGLEPPMIDSWTSADYIANSLLKVYEEVSYFVDKSGDASDVELKSSIPEFTSVIFACFTERIEYLSSLVPAQSEMGKIRDARRKVFDDLRPTVLLVDLVKHGFQSEAFDLAEKYLDFPNLAALCNMGVVYPPSENPHTDRIRDYVQRFREPFTDELLQWYIKNGEVRTLFAQEAVGEEYIDKFLTKDRYASLSWIHDLRKERYAPAADALFEESEAVPSVAVRQVMLSIGRLAYLAEEQEGAHEDREKLDALQDALSLVDVQQELLREFLEVLEGVYGRHSVEKQVELIARARASKLAETRAQHLIFKQLAKKILLGKVLTVEELADILSLMNNTDEDKYGHKIGLSNYANALHLLSQARGLHPTRLDTAFGSVWRRIYMHDGWDELHHTAGRSDAESAARFEETAMFRTLQETLVKRHNPPNYVCSPSRAIELMTADGIAARHPGVAPEQLEALIADAHEEIDRVRGYALDQDFERAEQLILQDMGFL